MIQIDLCMFDVLTAWLGAVVQLGKCVIAIHHRRTAHTALASWRTPIAIQRDWMMDEIHMAVELGAKARRAWRVNCNETRSILNDMDAAHEVVDTYSPGRNWRMGGQRPALGQTLGRLAWPAGCGGRGLHITTRGVVETACHVCRRQPS